MATILTPPFSKAFKRILGVALALTTEPPMIGGFEMPPEQKLTVITLFVVGK